jgi:large subunit ribosomal protein L4
MSSKSSYSVDVVDKHRKRVSEFDLAPFLFPKLDDHGEVYYSLKAFEAQTKIKPGYTKGRSEVSGSMKKMYKQKGTGQARHSTDKAPQFVGGGIAHGPKGITGEIKVNKQVWRKAMQLLLVQHLKNEKLVVFEELNFDKPKTKEAIKLIPEVNEEKVMFVGLQNWPLAYSVRNLKRASYKDASFVSIFDLAHTQRVVTTRQALETLLKRIQPHNRSRKIGDQT